tara:strand:+ start:608 stop:1717 length:1110 start_codon:yes stop_codon:yes gene_type:complete
MSQINIRNLCNENEDGAPTIVGVSTFSATSYFCPPKGTTAQRPENPVSGSLRFNTDTASLEYYRGDTLNWTQIEMTSPNLDGGARMLAGGGDLSSGTTNQIDFITISTFGNGQDFGDLTRSSTGAGASASRTRGLFTNRYASPSYYNEIDFVTIASTGNAADFGDSTVTNGYNRALSSQIRSCGLAFSSINTINYVTIATTGNAVDFGDQTGVLEGGAACASSTRGILAGGGNLANIDFITIMTTGNAQDFGDLSATVANGVGLSNSTRGVFKIRFQSGATNAMEFITIATTGNSTDFGDALNPGPNVASGASPTRGLFAGGSGVSSPYPKTNVIQKLEILTTGNAVDFGDMTFASNHPAGLSNAHGGL